MSAIRPRVSNSDLNIELFRLPADLVRLSLFTRISYGSALFILRIYNPGSLNVSKIQIKGIFVRRKVNLFAQNTDKYRLGVGFS